MARQKAAVIDAEPVSDLQTFANEPGQKLQTFAKPQNAPLQTFAKPTISAALAEYIERNGLRVRGDVHEPEHRREQLLAARNASTAASVMMGFWLADIRAAEGQQAFKVAIAELNISQRSAYNAIDVYNLFCRMPDIDAVAAIGQLEPSKALVFKGLDDSELTAFAHGAEVHGVTLEQAVNESLRELQDRERDWHAKDAEIAKTKRRNVELETDLDTARAELHRANAQLQHRFDHLPMPVWCAGVREEAVLQTEHMKLAIETLRKQFDNHLNQPKDGAESERFQGNAAGTLYHSLMGVIAIGHQFLQEIAEVYGDSVTGGVRFEATLLKGEAEHYAKQRDQLTAEHIKAAHNREVDRENAAGGRGRPRKKI